jgi:hypothetical protein
MDEANHRRWLNNKRFSWHEAVLRDSAVRSSAAAVALAGHIMHRYVPEKGCAQVSAASAAKALGFSERQIKRARKLLWERGWIRPFALTSDRPLGSWRAKRYVLAGGPEDLLFDASDGDGDGTHD